MNPSVGEVTVLIESRSPAAPVVGYASVAWDSDRPSKEELRSQTDTIVGACARRGLSLLEVVREWEPARGHALERPGLGYALERISAGEATGLVVADLSRLTRSVPELGRVLDWLSSSDARLIAAVPGLDTGDEGGRLTARMIIELTHWERDRLAERTRKGMLKARRKGPRSVADYPELKARIAEMRTAGTTLQAIADRLNAEGVPTVRGGSKWRPSSVQAATGYKRRLAVEPVGSPLGPGGW